MHIQDSANTKIFLPFIFPHLLPQGVLLQWFKVSYYGFIYIDGNPLNFINRYRFFYIFLVVDDGDQNADEQNDNHSGSAEPNSFSSVFALCRLRCRLLLLSFRLFLYGVKQLVDGNAVELR